MSHQCPLMSHLQKGTLRGHQWDILNAIWDMFARDMCPGDRAMTGLGRLMGHCPLRLPRLCPIL